MSSTAAAPPKAGDSDLMGRFREVLSDPLNLLIERVPDAGLVEGGEVILHNGNRVAARGDAAYYGQFSALLVINRGVHEPLEEYVFQELLRHLPEEPRMVELGAYWAHYSMWLKHARPRSSVVMVEPDANNLAAGQANFARNHLRGEFVQALVGHGAWSLDGFMQRRALSHLDVLHADIQGAEREMIEGGRRTLAAAGVDYLCVSTHSQALHEGLCEDLRRLGYRVEVSSDFDAQTTSFDGFVLAVSPRRPPVFRDFSHFGRAQIAASRAGERVQALLMVQASSTPAAEARSS